MVRYVQSKSEQKKSSDKHGIYLNVNHHHPPWNKFPENTVISTMKNMPTKIPKHVWKGFLEKLYK